MDTLFFYLAIATVLVVIPSGIELVLGNRSIGLLKDLSPSETFPGPKVSVLIPARNEAKRIEQALQSILSQNYLNLEVIVVNDRSTDGTGPILDRMAHTHPRLRVFHIERLPQGWLGKTHALFHAFQKATGQLILFTDADVVMEPSTLSRAVSYLMTNQLDHLTIAPEFRMPGIVLQMTVGLFTLFLSLFAKPWKAKDPQSRCFIGIGAFNLIRANTYQAIGTHKAIAMRPDDDIKLGKLVKTRGFRQDCLFGKQMIYVEWYASVKDLAMGLTKNIFAGFDYSIVLSIGASLAQILLTLWPFAGVFLTDGLTRFLNLAIILFLWLLYWDNAKYLNLWSWTAIGFPIASSLLIYIHWKSMLHTLLLGGIDWRNTHYPLSDLRNNKV
jgi:glycosyltransferase involved in cell wall biosynthesis